jgi:hypothetical protein
MRNAYQSSYKTTADVHANLFPFKLDTPKFRIFGARLLRSVGMHVPRLTRVCSYGPATLKIKIMSFRKYYSNVVR